MQEIVINIDAVYDYYGEVTVDILKQVMVIAHGDKQDVVGFIFDDKQYTNTLDETLEKAVADWNEHFDAAEAQLAMEIEAAIRLEKRRVLKARLQDLDNSDQYDAWEAGRIE